jgi:hypothetical protein
LRKLKPSRCGGVIWHQSQTEQNYLMHEQWAQRWVRALISGRYAQTKHCLHNAEGYDALGVLADISGLGYYSSVSMEEGDELRPRGFLLYDNSDKAAPTVLGQLEDLTGLSLRSIGIIAEMNDRGASFVRIAAFVAKYWQAL